MQKLMALLALVAVAGCAQTVQFRIYPPGARVTADDAYTCITPCDLRVGRSSSLHYQVQKIGYVSREGTLQARIAPGRVVGAIFTLGIVAMARSVYYFPADSIIDLAPAADPNAGLDVINHRGTGSIEGQAFTKTLGGELRYAAGNIIGMRPDTLYVRDALQFSSYKRAGINIVTSNPNLGFLAYARKTTGDGDGRFLFENVPAGKYIVTATITWGAPTREGLTEQRVEVVGDADVREGETTRVIVTDWRQPEFLPAARQQ